MATHNVNLDALVQLQEDLSGTISDFAELEIEDLSDMISENRQKILEIVVLAEEKIKYRESKLNSAIQARTTVEEIARSSEDGAIEVSSHYYEEEMRCREKLENARKIYDSIKNLADLYEDMVSQYYRNIDNLKTTYENKIREGNSGLEDVINAYIHLSGLSGTHEYIGDVKKVGYINDSIGLKDGQTSTHYLDKPSTGIFSTIDTLSNGSCFKLTTIPSYCVLLSINRNSSNSATIKGPATITKNKKNIKYKIRERRPISNGSKAFANTHLFQYPSINLGCVEQFDGFLKNELRSRSPFSIPIPVSAYITAEQMNVYDQVKYEWIDGEYIYICRWHTRTRNAPREQGDTWILHRLNINDNKTEYFVNEKWIPEKVFMNSDEHKKAGHVLDNGRFISILGEVIE